MKISRKKLLPVIISLCLFLVISIACYGSSYRLPMSTISPEVQARCATWRYRITGDSDDRLIKYHLSKVGNSLTYGEIMYEIGVAEGIATGLAYSAMDTLGWVIIDLYNEYCSQRDI